MIVSYIYIYNIHLNYWASHLANKLESVIPKVNT